MDRVGTWGGCGAKIGPGKGRHTISVVAEALHNSLDTSNLGVSLAGSSPGDGLPWKVVDLGRRGYADAMAFQRVRHQHVAAGHEPPALLLVEYDPVITVSRRASAAGHVLVSDAQRQAMGIDLQPTDRGGDVTYHGPGQVVAYPIVRLAETGLTLTGYVRRLESAIIRALAGWGIEAYAQPGATGVWTTLQNGGSAKIAAIGVRCGRGTTQHGLALNVTTELAHFDTIVPCGLHGQGVTSMHQLLGDASPTLHQVKHDLAIALQHALNPQPDPQPDPRPDLQPHPQPDQPCD